MTDIDFLRGLMGKATSLLNASKIRCSSPHIHHAAHRIIGWKIDQDAYRYPSDELVALEAAEQIVRSVPALIDEIAALRATSETSSVEGR